MGINTNVARQIPVRQHDPAKARTQGRFTERASRHSEIPRPTSRIPIRDVAAVARNSSQLAILFGTLPMPISGAMANPMRSTPIMRLSLVDLCPAVPIGRRTGSAKINDRRISHAPCRGTPKRDISGRENWQNPLKPHDETR
jgi:hypothetical protein